MIRSRISNFVCDYAAWRYPNLYTTYVTLTNDASGQITVKCFLCKEYYAFDDCKEVDDHVHEHVNDEGYMTYCGH